MKLVPLFQAHLSLSVPNLWDSFISGSFLGFHQWQALFASFMGTCIAGKPAKATDKLVNRALLFGSRISID